MFCCFFVCASPPPPTYPFIDTLILWENEKYWGATYMGQVLFVPDLYFPSFQCSSVFEPVEDIILGCFWDVFYHNSPKCGQIQWKY